VSDHDGQSNPGAGRLRAELTGYAEPLSVASGASVEFKVSTDLPIYQCSIVRLIHGDANGPGFKEEEMTELGVLQGRKQIAHAGSYGIAPSSPLFASAKGVTLAAWIFPTTPTAGRVQGLLSKWTANRGYALTLGPRGDLVFRVGDGDRVVEIGTGHPLDARKWYFVSATLDHDSGRVAMTQSRRDPWPADVLTLEAKIVIWDRAPVPCRFLVAALHAESDAVDGLYNGKIDRPAVFPWALESLEIDRMKAGAAMSEVGNPIAHWDFSQHMSGAQVADLSGNGLDMQLVNAPTRAVTGHNWRGDTLDFKLAPDQYGAVHFHDDDLEDARWNTDFQWHVPVDLKSGFYAARLRGGDSEDHIPFFVRRRPGQSTAKIVVLLPTMTYLAYANQTLQALAQYQSFYTRRQMLPNELDEYLASHPELGISTYDLHSDDSGSAFSSHRRPIPNMRPKYRQWQFDTPRHLGADLYLIDWLEALNFPYDVITDHDLHRDGKGALDPYRVVITGTHPEYWTSPMRDGLVAYLESGGRHMYLGGNGFYWVTSVDPDRPHLIEIRRGNSGGRAWDSSPGELFHSSTGEPGGLWRHRGMPPNQVAGVGFAAMGYDSPSPGYRRLAGSFDPRVEFIFEGIGTDEIIGDFGLVLGGAAGDEIDCFDHGLGTPRNAILLASATEHGSTYSAPVEDHHDMSDITRLAQKPRIRADMVYFETTKGGAVFSVGSIAWCGSLSHQNYRNNVSTITSNVLRRFAD